MRSDPDRKLWESNTRFCGVDEVGRGALAGPVAAAAVMLAPGARLPGVKDSKQLTPSQRRALEPLIRRQAMAVCVAGVSHRTIDRINILRATLTAMCRAVAGLVSRPDLVIVDGRALPDVQIPCTAIVGGDRCSLSIACASIIAKLWRDRLMARFDLIYPGYGFARNKGYGTPAHLMALRRLGPSPIHRRSFVPVCRAAES